MGKEKSIHYNNLKSYAHFIFHAGDLKYEHNVTVNHWKHSQAPLPLEFTATLHGLKEERRKRNTNEKHNRILANIFVPN